MDVKRESCQKVLLRFVVFVVVLLSSSINHASAQNHSDKLQVDILYESRCPDSRNFMQYQLKRAYPKIKDKVFLNYVPFGKAYSYDSNGGEKRFSCQHGARECNGNLYQSCVLDAIGAERQDAQTSFVICAMDFSKNPSHCAQNLGVDPNQVNECTHGERGIELQLQAEKQSKAFIQRSSFVPTIIYNNAYNAADFWESLDDFEGIVQGKLRNL